MMDDATIPPREHARGQVLITGLGMAVAACLNKPDVAHVTVVEVAPEVIALVGPHYQARYGARLTIVEADAHTWQLPEGTRMACAAVPRKQR